jgi:rRNA maturation endonuclease Nob1
MSSLAREKLEKDNDSDVETDLKKFMKRSDKAALSRRMGPPEQVVDVAYIFTKDNKLHVSVKLVAQDSKGDHRDAEYAVTFNVTDQDLQRVAAQINVLIDSVDKLKIVPVERWKSSNGIYVGQRILSEPSVFMVKIFLLSPPPRLLD